ncbi:MAG: ABC transporter ATP-binding protein [Geminicoccaceae bacterium]
MTPLLKLAGIRKVYPSVVANDGIDLEVLPGQIHAVLGENGAGKSTLMKIIYGVTAPDEGRIAWQGEAIRIKNPAHARALGIGMVFQHFSLFETLTVVENIALAVPGSLADLSKRIVEAAKRFGLDVHPDARVQSLTVGERQRVEILRCVLQEPKLLIMDEPTSVLPPAGIEQLFRTLKALAAEGIGILFISHKLDEIRELCDAATILRAGRVTGHASPGDETRESLARMMIGRDLPGIEIAPALERGDLRLEVKDLSFRPDDPFATALDGVSLKVRAGEVIGIAGVSGNGQDVLTKLLSGETVLPAAQSKAIRLNGEPIGHLGPEVRRRHGLNFIPEERLGRGAVPAHSLSRNSLLTGYDRGLSRYGLLKLGDIRALADRTIDAYDVRCGGNEAEARSLSGGNLQKFIVGREVSQRPAVLIVSQPTWGLDVGAAAAVRQRLIELRNDGTGVLVVSEEIEELFEIADRLHVMFRGRLSPAVDRATTDLDHIGLAMIGDFDHLVAERPIKETVAS